MGASFFELAWRAPRLPNLDALIQKKKRAARRENREASKKIFSYLSENRIRLINLHPGSFSDDIVCSIQEATISDSCPSYHALSYVWGSCNKPDYINLNRKRFCVTQNLAEALRRLRQENQIVVMWIDALCINQTDNNEKSTQVQLMGSIYERAERVVTFLGEHDEQSPVLLRALKALEEQGDAELVLEVLDPGEFLDLPAALHMLLRREYWERAWIVQEIVLARENWIYCGPDRVPYWTLQKLQESLASETLSVTIFPTDPIHNHRAGYLNEWHPRFQQISLFKEEKELSTNGFLDGFLDSQCSNPRDHIYAFYDLLQPNLRKHIEVNYDKRPEEVISQTAQAIITETQSLHIITLRGRQVWPSEAWQSATPSWCPFFGVPYINDPIPSRRPTLPYRTERIATFSLDGKLIHVKGVVIGEICETLSRTPLATNPFNNIDFEDTTRVDNEKKHAYKSIKFIKARAPNGFELNHTVLGDIVDSEDGLLDCLENRTEFDSRLMSSFNSFARYFHSRQVCLFSLDNSFIDKSIIDKLPPDRVPSDFAIIPERARIGDKLCAILGCEHLIILRQRDEHYTVVGEAKVYDRTGDDVLAYVDASKHSVFSLE